LEFKNKRYVTRGVGSKVSLLLQLFMWERIDELNISKDYLQVFNCTIYDGKQKITHIQEVPEYKREYLLNTGTPFYLICNYTIPY